MNIKMNRAKEIYFQYSSSKFQMMRDGLFEEYSTFNISESQEKVWLEEMINNEVNNLSIENTNTLFPLWYIIETNCYVSIYFQLIDWFVDNKNNYSELAQNHFKLELNRKITNYVRSCNESVERNKDLINYQNIHLNDR